MRKALLFSCAILVSGFQAFPAQITGIKSIPGDYATIAAAIAAINSNTIGNGGVTFNVAAGHTETFPSPTSGYITQTGASSKPIVFQKSGIGANPLVTAGTGTGSLDGIIVFVGSDYITFDGIDLQENSSNVTANAMMEYGYALLKENGSSVNGCQVVTIENCTVTLNRTNTNATDGIHIANHSTTSSTPLTLSSTSDANNNATVSNCTIQNSRNGITLKGYADGSISHSYYDQNNAVLSCTIQNFGGSAAGTAIYGDYQNEYLVEYNTIDNTSGGGVQATAALSGIVAGGSYGSWTARGNHLILQQGSASGNLIGISSGFAGNAILSANTLENFSTAGSSSVVYFFYAAGTSIQTVTGTVSIDSNLIQNCTSLNTAGDIFGISCGTATGGTGIRNINVRQNTFNNISRVTAASGKLYFLYHVNTPAGAGTETYDGNTITNISQPPASTCEFYGITTATRVDETKYISNNVISNITSGTGPTRLIDTQAGGTVTISYNSLNTFLNGGIMFGIFTSSNVVTVNNNDLYDLSTSFASTAQGFSCGLYISGGTAVTAYNNFIHSIGAPAGNSANAIAGIYLGTATTLDAYYNTIYLNASSSGTNFGSSGIYASINGTTELNNNIIINTSTASGTGKTVAYRRSSTGLGTYTTTSDNNDFYAGTPSATNLIYIEGTSINPKQTLALYQAYVTPRDANSFTEFPPFENASTPPFDLHIKTTVGTFCESGGITISSPSITTDYDDDARYPNAGYPNNPVPAYTATNPDVGADEFGGIQADLSPPSIVYTPLDNTSQTTARTLTASITDPNGVPTNGTGLPMLYWKINSGSYTGVQGVYSAPSYNFTFGAGVSSGDVVSYYIVAQDGYTPPNVGAYPNLGAGGYTANPPAAGTPPSNPSTYSITGPLAGGNYKIGGTGTTPCPVCQYVDITAAFADLNYRSVSGAIDLVLTSYYSSSEEDAFPVVLNPVQGASGTNKITLKPDAGVSPVISGSSASSVIKLNGADYFVIDGSNAGTTSRDLTITNTSTSNNTAALWVASQGTGQGATNVTIKNCNISAGTPGSTSANTFGIYAAGASISATGTGDDNDNLVIQNNQITKAYYGVYAKASATGVNTGLSITQNLIGSDAAASYIGHMGITVGQASGTTLSQNTIKNIIGTQCSASYPYHSGIDAGTGTTFCTISRNLIRDVQYTGTGGFGARGISVTGSGSVSTDIVNNAISGILADGNGTNTSYCPWGISVEGGSAYTIYYNSVSLTGNRPDNSYTGILSGDLLIGAGTSGMNIRNNIFMNTMTSDNIGNEGTNYAVYCLSPNTGFTNINYNNYFTNSATFSVMKVIGFLDGVNQTTLTDWKAATGFDQNSYWYNPCFTGTSDLTPCASNNGGVPIAGIPGDIDGSTRDVTNPDIGSYESNVVVPALTWTGSGGTSWDSKASWNPSTTLPNPSIHVVIPGVANMPVVPVSGECNNLTINTASMVDHGAGKWITIWGNLVIQSGGGLNNQGSVILKGNLDNQNSN